MSVGPVELVQFVVMVILALAAHVVILLLAPEKGHKEKYRGFLVYGVPLCFAAAAILTPPDLLSMLLVAVPCSLVYGAIAAVWILRRTHARPQGSDASKP